jgi:F-type H+-transporting ATPase subunit b
MLLVLALLLGLATAGAPGLAQEAQPAAPPSADAEVEQLLEEDAGAAHGERHGMPQLDAGTYTSQIFWLILSFGALFWLLRRKALPRVAEVLEIRQDRIAADLDRAASLRGEAEEVLRRYEALVAEARAKGAERLKAAQERLVAEAAARRAPLEQELQKRLAEAERRIAAARRAALGEIQDVAAETAQLAALRLAGIEVDAAAARQAMEAVLREAA